jgi:DNA-binding GntR family transcriptional regulator
VELVREAALAAFRDGDRDTATGLYDAAQVMRRAIGRKTWRSLASADEAELRAIVERMAERVRQ